MAESVESSAAGAGASEAIGAAADPSAAPIDCASAPPAPAHDGVATANPRSHNPWLRAVILLVVLAVIGSAAYFLFFTDTGRQLQKHPHAAGIAFRKWVDGHLVVAPLILL